MDDQMTIPKMMMKEDWRQFINEWDRITDSGDAEAMRILKAPVREAMAFGGFKDIWSYLETCVQVDAARTTGIFIKHSWTTQKEWEQLYNAMRKCADEDGDEDDDLHHGARENGRGRL